MNTKYVSDTAAGKSVSAWVILNRRNQHVATIRAHFAATGGVLVNVFNHGASKDAEHKPFQCGRAGGWGYDKFTAAISGLTVDGHTLTNHCEVFRRLPAGKLFSRDAKPPRGFSFANYVYRDKDGKDLPESEQGYGSCYREPGLKYLEAIGYKVISAI